MGMHMEREIERLKKQILGLCALVEESVRMAVTALERRDVNLADQVTERDLEIDRMEIEVEEECLKILALHQPVAVDLRFIIAVLKLNNDLERIGDLAVNIAERASFLCDMAPAPVPFDFDTMAEKARNMLKRSLDALVNSDVKEGAALCVEDDEVDAINEQMYAQVKAAVRQHPEHLDALIHLLSVSRHLERIADHATNIAEDVIYFVEGRIARHHPDISPATGTPEGQRPAEPGQ